MEATQMKPKAPDAIAKALATLRSVEEKVAAGNKALVPLDAAINKAHGLIAERENATKRVEDLHAQRRAMLTESLTGGKPDVVKTAILDRDLPLAEKALSNAVSVAGDAQAAILELGRRRSLAAAPIADLQKNVPRLRAAVLTEAAETLLDRYGIAICDTHDLYVELVCLAQEINRHGRAAGLQPISPDAPDGFSFPSITLKDYRLENRIRANGKDIVDAQKRLAKKLADLGISG